MSTQGAGCASRLVTCAAHRPFTEAVHFRNSSLYLGFGVWAELLPSLHVDDVTTSAYILLSVVTGFIVIELLCNGLECLPVLLNGIPEGGEEGRRL